MGEKKKKIHQKVEGKIMISLFCALNSANKKLLEKKNEHFFFFYHLIT